MGIVLILDSWVKAQCSFGVTLLPPSSGQKGRPWINPSLQLGSFHVGLVSTEFKVNSSEARVSGGGRLHTVALRPTLLYGEQDPRLLPSLIHLSEKMDGHLLRFAGSGGRQQITYVGKLISSVYSYTLGAKHAWEEVPLLMSTQHWSLWSLRACHAIVIYWRPHIASSCPIPVIHGYESQRSRSASGYTTQGGSRRQVPTHPDFTGKGLLSRARDEIYNGSKYDKVGIFGGSSVNTQEVWLMTLK
jgi:hypothetical protein